MPASLPRLDDEEARKAKRKKNANKRVVTAQVKSLDPNRKTATIQVNNYCKCAFPDCRVPALTTTGSLYCAHHYEYVRKQEAGEKVKLPVFGSDKERAQNTPAWVFAEDKDRQLTKAQKKASKKAMLAQLAFQSGNPEEFMRLRMLDKLRRGGRLEQLFSEMDQDHNGTVDPCPGGDHVIRASNLMLSAPLTAARLWLHSEP